jgi:hypothetical protein
MAARQLPPGRGAAPADPRRRAAQLLRATAQAGHAAAGGPAARVRHRVGLCGAHRQRAQQDAVHRLPERLPGHRRAHARRALGAAHHTARGAAGEPAPRGREHCREQGRARDRARRLGCGTASLRARPGRALPRAAKPRPAGQLPHAALAAPAGRARREHARAGALDRAALPQRPGAHQRCAERAGGGQPHGRQHHHHAAHDRPGRVERPDRAGEPLAARAARAAELRERKRTHAPADHACDGARGARHRAARARSGRGRGAHGRERAGRRRCRGDRPRRRHRGLLPLRPGPPGADRRAAAVRWAGGPQRPRGAHPARAQPTQLAIAGLSPVRRRGHRVAAVRRGARPRAPRRLDHRGRARAARMAALRGADRAGAADHGRVGARAGAAAPGLRDRHSRAAPRARRHPDAADLGREQRAARAPARTALARQPRAARAVRAPDRLGRCRAGLAARRCAAARRRHRARRRAQREIPCIRRRGAALPRAAPPAHLERHRSALDGLGAQARQAGDAGAPAGERQYQQYQ